MLARNSIEELLVALCLQQGVMQPLLQLGQTVGILQQRGEQMCAHGELATFQQLLVQVVPHEIQPRQRHQRHIAHAGNALGVQLCEQAAIGLQQLFVGETLHDLGHQLHGRCLAHDASEMAVGIFVVTTASRRYRVFRDAQPFQCAGVQPQRVGIARVHGHRLIGVGRIQRGLRGHPRRFPQIIAPALGKQPTARRPSRRQRRQPRHRVRFVFATVALCQIRPIQGAVKHMDMSIVEPGHEEPVWKLQHRQRHLACPNIARKPSRPCGFDATCSPHALSSCSALDALGIAHDSSSSCCFGAAFSPNRPDGFGTICGPSTPRRLYRARNLLGRPHPNNAIAPNRHGHRTINGPASQKTSPCIDCIICLDFFAHNMPFRPFRTQSV